MRQPQRRPALTFRLTQLGPDRYLLEGELGFASAEQAQSQMSGILAAGMPIIADLGGVGRADSAGLALLLDWQRRAQSGGGSLRYINLPQQLTAIAHVVGVEEILAAAVV